MGFSGAIAALAFGIVIGNPESLHLPFIKRFVSEELIGLNRRERTFFSENFVFYCALCSSSMPVYRFS
jgi:hypothetical protein